MNYKRQIRNMNCQQEKRHAVAFYFIYINLKQVKCDINRNRNSLCYTVEAVKYFLFDISNVFVLLFNDYNYLRNHITIKVIVLILLFLTFD